MFYGIAWFKKNKRTNLIRTLLCLLLGGDWSSVGLLNS